MGRKNVEATALPAMVPLLALKPGPLWRVFKRQDLAYWGITAYLIVEYVRPQQLIAGLYGLPIGTGVILFTLVAWVLSGHWFKASSGANLLMLLYTFVVLVSSAFAFQPQVSIDAWPLFLSWVLIYFLIINIVNTEERFALFMMGWLLWNFYMSQGAAKQWAGRGFSYTNWGVKGAPGWFENSGEFGIEMCIFAPIAWHFYVATKPYLPKWKQLIVLAMPITAVMGMIGSSSRGALVGGAATALFALLRTKGRVKAIVTIAVVGTVVWAATPPEQKARFTNAGEDSTSTRRVTYWINGMDMARKNPVLGVGYGNWLTYYRAFYVDYSLTKVAGSLGRAQLSHNIFVECVAELGYVGLMVFLSLIAATFVINYKTRKLARAGPDPEGFLTQMAYGLDSGLVGLLVSGFFVTVLYYPFFWINMALTVALSVSARHRVRTWRASGARQAMQAAPVPVPAVARGPGWRSNPSLPLRRSRG